MYSSEEGILSLSLSLCVLEFLNAFQLGLTLPTVEGLSRFDEYSIPLQPSEEFTLHLFEDIFVHNEGMFPHLEWTLGFFPQYLENHFIISNALMRSDGPLPIPWRYYIAIMVCTTNISLQFSPFLCHQASARLGCVYLVKRLEIDFLLCGAF